MATRDTAGSAAAPAARWRNRRRGKFNMALLRWFQILMSTPVSLMLRRIILPDGSSRPDDYEVIHGGKVVGRIYRMTSTARETWRWNQIGQRVPTQGPNGGI